MYIFMYTKYQDIHTVSFIFKDTVNKMTDKKLRKLKRADLLEILYYLKKENDDLKTENESLKQQLENSSNGISEESLEKIISAVKDAVGNSVREHSDTKPATQAEK